MKHPQVVLFGSTGRLGRAVDAALTELGRSVEGVSWLHNETKAARQRSEILARLAALEGDVDIVFAGGLTDPRASITELTLANVERVAGVIEDTIHMEGFRYLTIGSVLETFSDLAANNPYLASKAELWKRIEALNVNSRLSGRLTHLRGHTFYGGAPTPHLFLGQMYESLREGRPFRMSQGNQLREYSHVEDVASSIVALLGRVWREPAAIDLSTGKPVRLSDLALAVFGAFRCEDLLKIGALPTPVGENLNLRFARSPDWLLGRPRASVAGIIEWLSVMLNRRYSR